MEQENQDQKLYEKQQRELTDAAFRNLFATPQGSKVLAVILEDLGFYRFSANDGDRVLNNFAKSLLTRCGLWQGNKNYEIVNALYNTIRPGDKD